MPANKPHPAQTTRTITVEGVKLTLVVHRKDVKNVNARLRGDMLLVSAPPRMPQATLDAIVVDLARRLVRRAHANSVNGEEDAASIARRVAAGFSPLVPRPLAVSQVIFVTTQQRRWGSYSPTTRTIRLNAVLRRMPRWVLEAVMAHELAHAVHPDHSPAFWKLTRHVCPETDRARAFLAGVSWLGSHLMDLPEVERTLLSEVTECDGDRPSEI